MKNYRLDFDAMKKGLRRTRKVNVECSVLDKEEQKQMPTFLRIMSAKKPSEIVDLSLEDVVSIIPCLEKYCEVLDNVQNPLYRGFSEFVSMKGVRCQKRRVL